MVKIFKLSYVICVVIGFNILSCGCTGAPGFRSDIVVEFPEDIGAKYGIERRIQGIILDGHDQPVANATIKVFLLGTEDWAKNEDVLSEVQADDQGQFEITATTAGLLVAWAPGYARSRCAVPVSSDSASVILYLEPAVSATYVFSVCEFPYAVLWDGHNFLHSARFDEHCSVQFDGLAPGNVLLSVSSDGVKEIGSAHILPLNVLNANELKVDPWGTSIKGVVAVEGIPASGIEVDLELIAELPVEFDTVTDKDGKFTFREVEYGSWRLRAVVNGSEIFKQVEISVPGETFIALQK